MSKESRLRAIDHQIRRLEQRLRDLNRTSYRYSWLRIGVVLAGLLASALTLHFVGAWPAGGCLAATALLFGLAVYAHRRVENSIRQHQTWLQLKTAHLARARLDWAQIPEPFHLRPQTGHPFEADLDLLGQRSLHRLLDTAVTYEGSQRLRAWLTEPVPERQQIERRQQLVRELAPRHLFRDKLILNARAAARASKTWRASQLLDWLERGMPEVSLLRWLVVFGALAGLNAALFVAHRLGILPAWWQISLALYLGLLLVRSRATAPAWDEAQALQGALQQLLAVLRHLETFSYRNTPHLRALCAPLLDAAHRPSRYLARLTRVVAAMSARGNPLLWFGLNAVAPWDHYFAYRLGRYKAELARRAPAWLDLWFELEALGSLANFAYLNPGYAFPELSGAGAEQTAAFEALALGHPLIPDSEKVCNDFTIPELGQVTIITGSNMAGKSVFLKTVGANLALTYAGGPVNARRLRTAMFRLFTCMGITDSVTDGISYFYAEVQRLKALLDALESDHPLPLLFCIDEIFRGTNNRERLLGSLAYVRALAGGRGAGLIATHDLELASLADQLPQVVNHHFRDHITEGRMAFDYVLRSGSCPTTNALTIMQLEGLPVPPSREA